MTTSPYRQKTYAANTARRGWCVTWENPDFREDLPSNVTPARWTTHPTNGIETFPHEAKAYDADGIHYYTARVRDEKSAEHFHDWAVAYAGATTTTLNGNPFI